MDKKMFTGNVKWYISFAFGAFFGALVFISLYGVKILDVTYDDWLLTGWYDLSQHYVGWKLYRASGWHFPLGLCDTSFYPYLASVIYTDSIPILCFFFKLISPLLPSTFQFFGLYGIFCFMMQGGVAKLLLRKVMKTEAQCCVACVPFVFCAPVWQRLYYHTALASHYLILLAIMLFMYRDGIKKRSCRVLLWCLLGVLCILVHFTLYGIVSVMLLGFSLWEILDTPKAGSVKEAVVKRGRVFIGYLIPYLFSTVLSFYIFGGFYGNISGVSDGLGSYSANLNALFNPIDYSRIIKELPLRECQYEGLSYIGMTAIILFIPAVAYIGRNFKTIWGEHRNYIISMIFTGTVLWIIALSPRVTFGSVVLFEIPVKGFVYDVWSLFRASGRFVWPVMYAVILIVLYYARYEVKTYYIQLLVLGCLLQVFEFSEKVGTISEKYEDLKEARFPADRLDLYDWNGIKHLQFMHDYYFGEFYGDEIRDQMIGYTEFALRHGMTVSNFHFSRDDMEKVRDIISECDERLKNGKPDEDMMYVFRKEDVTLEELRERYSNVEYIVTDNDIILTAKKVR